jgi:hypothetical protein
MRYLVVGYASYQTNIANSLIKDFTDYFSHTNKLKNQYAF